MGNRGEIGRLEYKQGKGKKKENEGGKWKIQEVIWADKR